MTAAETSRTRARGWLRMVVVVLTLVAIPVLSPIGSQAGHGDACSWEWGGPDSAPKHCDMSLYGSPIRLFADAQRNCANCLVEVHAYVQVSTSPITILECHGEGRVYARCEADISTAGQAIAGLIGTVPLGCPVVSNGYKGTISCSSGCVLPSDGIECQILATSLPTPTGT